MVRIESLSSHTVPGDHLAKFLQTIKTTQTFQGVDLRGSPDEKAKRGGIMTGSLQSEIQNAVNLCTKGLNGRFDILLNAIEEEHQLSIT